MRRTGVKDKKRDAAVLLAERKRQLETQARAIFEEVQAT